MYWHFFKLKLYQYKDTRREHVFHTLRNLCMLVLAISLFNKDVSQSMLIIGSLAVIADVIILIVDLLIESSSRSRFGGLSKWEYVIHVMANGFYFLSVIVMIQLKYTGNFLKELTTCNTFFEFIIPLINLAIVLSLILHLYLYFAKGNGSRNIQ